MAIVSVVLGGPLRFASAERTLGRTLWGGVMGAAPEDLPVPAPHPGPITMDQYHAIPIEKFEFWRGYLFFPADYREPRRHLLAALLVNEGLLEAVKLAPEEHWRKALQRVYGSGGG
jgi:hypothetical protein